MSEQVQENQFRKQPEKKKDYSKNSEDSNSFTDNRPESILHQQLQELANNSPQSVQATLIQKMADESPASQAYREIEEMAQNCPSVKQAIEIQNMAANSPGEIAQRKLFESIFSDPAPTIQKKEDENQLPLKAKENKTGLPDKLKQGIENLSGTALDDVKVHYNSSKPSCLDALAYAQGNHIHLAPGQEQHLPHEAWHVAQQKQGRVHPTVQMKGVEINDDDVLEQEADEMGKKALAGNQEIKEQAPGPTSNSTNTIQRFEAPAHEAAERSALTSKRSDGREFTNEEASMTYFGNWMRDMNQLMVPAFAEIVGTDGAFALIKVLGIQKFGREITPEQFGYYIPSEHLDNPAGQVKGQDFFAEPPSISENLNATGKDRYNTQDFPERPDKYVTPQEGADPADTVLGANIFDVDQTGVMAYIRRTNLHVERRLELAALKGRTPEGLMHFGAALHAVEDLFSHSNFVEIAVNKVLQENPPALPNGQPGLLPELTGADRRVETLSPKMADGTPILVTGTFTGLDTLHSVGSEGVKMLRQGMKPSASKEERQAQEALVSLCLKKMESLKNNQSVLDQMVKKSGLPESVVKQFNVSTFYDHARKILPNIAFNLVHDYIVGFINTSVLEPAATELEAKLLVTKVQDTPVNKHAKDEVDKTVDSKGQNVSPMQEVISDMTGVKHDPQKTLNDAKVKKSAIDRTPLNVKAGASHTQLSKDHTNSVFFGLAFRLATEADILLRDKMLDVWGNAPKVTDPDLEEAKEFRANEAAKEDSFFHFASKPGDDILMAEARAKKEQESLAEGNQIYNDGKKAGQKYNLEEMRNESADRIKQIAAVIRLMARAPSTAKISIEDLKKQIVNDKQLSDQVNINTTSQSKGKTITPSLINGILLQHAQSFDAVAMLVRQAESLKERENAHLQLEKCKSKLLEDLSSILLLKDVRRLYGGLSVGSLIIMIDREIAVVAPAYTTDQLTAIDGGPSSNKIRSGRLSLPAISNVDKLPVNASQKTAIKQLLEISRKIINHPYQNDWWKKHVTSFIKEHSNQITEEIKAKNSGVAHFGGLHNH